MRASRGQRRRGPGHPGSATARPQGGAQADAKLLKKHGVTPDSIVTDKLGSYRSALRELGIAWRHDTGRWKNNRAENSHQPLRQRTTYEALQVARVGTALSLNPRRRLQRVQPPTPSDLTPNPALISRSDYADMAPRDSRSVNRCGHAHVARKSD